jgi:O-antigen/teichoic acid export membrane protein
MSLRAKAAKGVAWTGLSAAVVGVLNLLQLAILARLLPPEAFGLMAMAVVFVSVAGAFSDLGISESVVHFQRLSSTQLSTLYWMNVVASIGLFTLLTSSASTIAGLFREPALTPVIQLIAVSFLIAPWSQLFVSLLQKELQFLDLAKIDIASAMTSFVAAIALAASGAGVYSLVWAGIAGTLMRTMIAVALAHPNWRPSMLFMVSSVRPMLSFGLYRLGERSLNIFQQHLDKLILGLTLGSADLGRYAVATQVARAPLVYVNPILTRVAFPAFAALQRDDRTLRQGFMEVLSAVALLQVPVYFGLIIVADRLIPAFLGDAWVTIIPTFQIFCTLFLLKTLANPLGALMLAKGRADWAFYWNIVGLVINALAAYYGSFFGTEGVAIALLVAHVFVFIPIGVVIRKRLISMTIIDYLRPLTAPFIAASAMAVIVYLAGQRIVLGPIMAELLILVLIGLASYLFVLLVVGRPALRHAILTFRARKQ